MKRQKTTVKTITLNLIQVEINVVQTIFANKNRGKKK